MTSSNRRVFALTTIIAGHFALALIAVQGAADLVGLQELPVVLPLVVGLLWGQATLLGQFLVLARRWPLVRVLLAASWFSTVIYLGEPFFRATGGREAFVACCVILVMPFVFTVLLMPWRTPARGR